MATIKAIEGQSVHQIQSGQVIVDLNSVAKELVENSLDAGASSIDIRFKNNGLDSIEVQDNGKGISPDDYETIALKHYTSKLSTYEDLTSLDTFGFRGEALSSLCALSKFHIVTARAEDGAVGKRLDFETSGTFRGATVTAAQRGTTVTVENLFCNLPVRRKELEKNVKREYGKVIGLLHAYACISVGVRFSVSNQMPKGKKASVFSTKSNTTTKENIVNVFGAKTLLALIQLDLHLEMSPSHGPTTQGARNWSTQPADRSMEVHVHGHISRPVFGEGRQAPDRQMFFVNSRPCLLPQVSKAMNEVYKSFNVSQSPFIFANLIMDTSAYDVNVSPDKRTIMLHDQTALLESLKAALTEMFEQTDHTVPQSTLPNKKLPSYQPLSIFRQTCLQSAASERDDPDSVSEDSETDPEPAGNVPAAVQGLVDQGRRGTQPSLIESWAARDSAARPKARERKRSSPELPRQKQVTADAGIVVARNSSLASNKTFTTAVADPTHVSDIRSEAEVCSHATSRESYNNTAPQPEYTDMEIRGLAESSEPGPMSTAYDDLFSQRPSRLRAEAGHSAASEARMVEDEDASETTAEQRSVLEPPIVAVAPSSQRATPGPVANAFDRMRPRRTPLQTAEITIGDTTTTTVIGSSPMYKRRRVHAPQDSQTITKFGVSPSLIRGLNQFAAPGSEMELESSDLAQIDHRMAQFANDVHEDESESDHEADAQYADPDGDSRALPVLATSTSEVATSDPIDSLLPKIDSNEDHDEDYIDEDENRTREDEKVARLIQKAEEAASRPTEENLKRASQVLRNGGNRKQSTLQLMQNLNSSIADVEKRAMDLHADMVAHAQGSARREEAIVQGEIDDAQAENKLSLTVSKSDFEHMVVVGQFNLGFVLAIRPGVDDQSNDELFIIDQHAADEKYNYERLQRTVTLQSQRLVHPLQLELAATQEEIIINHPEALKANGFEVDVTSHADEEGEKDIYRLVTLPVSGEKTFDLSDLEELLHLLSECSSIPRPKKVQRMLAMRACRSSVMVGKTLTKAQMSKVVTHMGEMEKPWNCPHGRPTMRHLAGLGGWEGWKEGEAADRDVVGFGAVNDDGRTDWGAWLAGRP